MNKHPTKADILEWISANPTLTSKRDIAKAFGIKGAARIDLKRVLKELEHEGHLEKRKKTYRDPDRLPPVSVVQVNAPNADGDLFATPLEWHGEGVEPIILLVLRETGDTEGALTLVRTIAERFPEQTQPNLLTASLLRLFGQGDERCGVVRSLPAVQSLE